MGQIEHILLATDGSRGALEAAALAGELARNCAANISVVVVHSKDALVLPAMTSAVLPGSVPFTPFPKKDAIKLIEKTAAEGTLSETERALGDIPGECGAVQLWGHAAQEICKYARLNNVDMIIIGRRGQSPFKKLLLGGVTTQVVNHAPCAVLVAR